MRNQRTRQVLAVMAVTTALCADQVVAAAPALRPQVAHLAGRIVERLTLSFRRTVAAAIPVRQDARRVTTASAGRTFLNRGAVCINRYAATPFEFRLPPPLA